ncbi:alpha/beta hydrolase [Alishewanella sp. WH16-1]|uniref:alpha/beta hydrolase n=1 Tax=Alishewanella sp. WH16-1 TaxID=1651088 RepID=UPI000B19A92A|nr:alpha/beta hydrolase-fold protein [Alishewanella sp. WH16-1]
MAQITNDMTALLALLLVSLTGGYLVVLGVLALFRPRQAQSFLLGFASSARLHYLEMVIRLLVGLAFIHSAEYVVSTAAFTGFGWLLLLTSLPLLLLPWQWHRRFATQAVNACRRYLVLIGVSALVLGVAILLAVLKNISAPAGAPLSFLPALQGDYFKFDSAEVARPFHIYVRLPADYDSATTRYPVVYLLDGDSLFPILAANHLFLTYDEGLPEAIIVGIAYGAFDSSINKRSYDFSAPTADASAEQGGAPAFQRFLALELMPEVARRYRIDSSKQILFGQSRGGYFVLYSAFTQPDLFWGRIASNPTFEPGAAMFFSAPPSATRSDLGLVVTSGARDWPKLRQAALNWQQHWQTETRAPWQLRVITIDKGTHAASSPESYRQAMLWLFNRTEVEAPPRNDKGQ